MVGFEALFREASTYLSIFLVISLLAFLSRGRKAFTWSKDMKVSALVNFGFVKFNAAFGGIFFIFFVMLEDIYPTLNLPTLSSEFWESVPAPLTWLALLLVYDVALYWIHRWLHSGWMWPMHAVHHSDEELHFLSWSRGHALEQTVILCFVFICSAWMGLEIKEILFLAYWKAMHQYYVHANIDWDHGWFKKIIASPQYHRWHHANVKEAYDKNFASIFPFIDIIFGTYYHPHSAVDVPTGFENSPGNDFIALMTYPFTEWARMIKEHRVKTKVNAQPARVDTKAL